MIMAIPLNSDPLLPQVLTHSGCGQYFRQKYGENQTRNFSTILGEAFLSRTDQDPYLTATVESLVLSILRHMQSSGPASANMNAAVVKTPYLTYSRMVDSSTERVHDSEASKECQMDAEGKSESRTDLNDLIQRASKAHDVDAGLVSAVIRVESNFDPAGASDKGAMGLMQLMPETARELGVENPYDPEENIMGGVRYLRTLLDRYAGNVRDALAAYNWGMGNLERNPGRLPAETREYIARVLKYYEGVSV